MEKLISVIQEIFAIINTVFILAGGSGTGLSFYDVQNFSWYLLIC